MARPRITLKLATSLDGKIALANGASEWITSEDARAAGRRLRAEHDAICVGSNTAHLDNPQLTARIDGASEPIRVVFDSCARLSPASNLARTAKQSPVIVFCRDGAEGNSEALKALGVQVLPIAQTSGGLDVMAALDILKRQGVDSLLVEGGGRLAGSFVALGVIDIIEWFRAPIILGGDGRDCIGALGLETMNKVYKFERVSTAQIGVDLRETYQKRKL